MNSVPAFFRVPMRQFVKFLPPAALALLLSACGGGVERDFARREPPIPVDVSAYDIQGIDVSKYQGDIDWGAAKAGGVRFAWIKATEGADHTDEKFVKNWQDAKEAGLPRGAYHFAFWCRSPAEQMRWFEQNVPVEKDALPPVLDVELTPTSKTCKRLLYRDEILREMREMLELMERHYGKRPVIYTTVDFHEGILHSNALSEYPIWVRSTKYQPHVKYGSRSWHFWQYQSDGRVAGIKTKVDRNAFHGGEAQWEAFLQGPK